MARVKYELSGTNLSGPAGWNKQFVPRFLVDHRLVRTTCPSLSFLFDIMTLVPIKKKNHNFTLVIWKTSNQRENKKENYNSYYVKNMLHDRIHNYSNLRVFLYLYKLIECNCTRLQNCWTDTYIFLIYFNNIYIYIYNKITITGSYKIEILTSM